MPLDTGVHGTSHRTLQMPAQRPRRLTRIGVLLAVATLTAFVVQLAPGSVGDRPARAATPLKAVIIVGPTNELTDSNLGDAERLAEKAEAVGMDVRRVFFPKATWENVLAQIQGANFVVYMGHGYGWPSPYTREMTESRQNGMGLNSWEGSGKAQYTYYGAKRIRESIRLAPNAIVFLNHLCYAAGNGESGMSIPSEDVARQRVDNMANGWLAAGARAVFAYTWDQKLNYPSALMTSDMTVDEMFMTPAWGSPNGFVGWRNKRFDSQRTPGATNHLDPHSRYGYYRAVTGDLSMTAAEWRSGSAPTHSPPPAPDTTEPPQITELNVNGASSHDPGTVGATADGVAQFHPNGDGLDEEVLVSHSVTRAAYLDVSITNAEGQPVRSFSVWSPSGASTSRWNGRNNAGAYVADGTYTMTYVPRDSNGVVGEPVTAEVLVLTAIRLGQPTKSAFHPSDGDSLARATTFAVTTNQPTRVTWQLVDGDGATARTVRSDSPVSATVLKFKWDGRSDSGAWAPDGWYRSIVTAVTDKGAYSQERQVYVGAFRITPSANSPARGDRLVLTILSTEPLGANPKVFITQPGHATWKVNTTKIGRKKYKVAFTLKTGGEAGSLDLVVRGVDKYGGTQLGSLSLALR